MIDRDIITGLGVVTHIISTNIIPIISHRIVFYIFIDHHNEVIYI